ncbi:MAG: hypothetical protein H6696_10610 [Deferribacteres bacterium]|nr:hypothetical protein [candidate division KSB1 bacterium]MCB9502382.1 hypothetical protein [Deferribacteres bacterium]
MATVIFHIEIANFLATALEHQHAKLRGRPFVIAPLGADRARVYGASQVARSMGIHTGMLVRDVRRIDRSIIVNPMENKLFKDISERMVKTVANFSPVFEPWRYGNIYLEFLARKQAWERARDTAWRLQKEVKQQVELEPAVGLASNKMVSRTASQRSIRQRDIITVPEGAERGFVRPFDITFLPHVDRKIALELRNMNIHRISDVTRLSCLQLQELFGRTGWYMHEEAQGIDRTPIIQPDKQPALYAEWTFAPETNDATEIDAVCYTLLNRLARQLREKGLRAGRISLSATFADDRFFAQWRKISNGGQSERELLAGLYFVREKLLERRVALRRIGIRLLHLAPATQLDLFTSVEQQKEQNLLQALDKIQKKYGEKGVFHGSQVLLFNS